MQLREALLKRPDVFVGNFTEKLMITRSNAGWTRRDTDRPEYRPGRGQRNHVLDAGAGHREGPAFQMRMKAEASDSGVKTAQSAPTRLAGVSLR